MFLIMVFVVVLKMFKNFFFLCGYESKFCINEIINCVYEIISYDNDIE